MVQANEGNETYGTAGPDLNCGVGIPRSERLPWVTDAPPSNANGVAPFLVVVQAPFLRAEQAPLTKAVASHRTPKYGFRLLSGYRQRYLSITI